MDDVALHVVLQGGEQVAAKFSLERIGVYQPFGFDQVEEKALDRILSAMMIEASPPGEGIKRLPVGAAKFGERFFCTWSLGLGGGEDNTPAGGFKSGR